MGLREETCGLAIGSMGWLTDELSAAGIGIHCAPHLQRSSNPIAISLARNEVAAIFRRELPNIVHAHGVIALLATLPLASAVPLVYTAHGFQWHDHSHRWVIRVATKFVHRLASRRVRLVIALVPAEADEARALGFPRVQCVLHGVPTAHVQDRIRASRVLGVATRLVCGKGLDTFIAVLARIPESQGWIAGDGPMKDRVAKLIDANDLNDRVRLSGWVDDLTKFYEEVSVYVSLSLKEGLPYAVLDASAHGVPLVLSDIRGHREIVQDGYNGYLVDARDVDAVADKVNSLLTNETERARLGHNAIKTMSTHYSLSRMILEYQHLYDEMGGAQ